MPPGRVQDNPQAGVKILKAWQSASQTCRDACEDLWAALKQLESCLLLSRRDCLLPPRSIAFFRKNTGDARLGSVGNKPQQVQPQGVWMFETALHLQLLPVSAQPPGNRHQYLHLLLRQRAYLNVLSPVRRRIAQEAQGFFVRVVCEQDMFVHHELQVRKSLNAELISYVGQPRLGQLVLF